jgi:L-fuconolactonase
MPRSTPVVDAHCHTAGHWYLPIESLLFEMERAGVDQAVLVQMMGEFDASYQRHCVRRYPGRFANVVLVEWSQPDAPERLAEEAAQGASGVRLRADARSPGADPLAIWRAAERLGLAVSCLGRSWLFLADEFRALLETITDVPIVIEHLGAHNAPDDDTPSLEQRRAIFALSRYGNVRIKFHGLGEFTPKAMPVRKPWPFVDPVPPLLELAYEAFGPRRMMWGSDYPPVAVREGYAHALEWPSERLGGLSENDREWLFGRTALGTFPVR